MNTLSDLTLAAAILTIAVPPILILRAILRSHYRRQRAARVRFEVTR